VSGRRVASAAQVYQLYSLAMAASQVAELTLINVLLLTHRPSDGPVDRFIVRAARLTLGQLLKHLVSRGVLSRRVLALLEEMVEARNGLAHRFMRQHILSIGTRHGNTRTLAELRRASRRVITGHLVLAAVVEKLLVQKSADFQ
jgi:hypothetical protein